MLVKATIGTDVLYSREPTGMLADRGKTLRAFHCYILMPWRPIESRKGSRHGFCSRHGMMFRVPYTFRDQYLLLVQAGCPVLLLSIQAACSSACATALS